MNKQLKQCSSIGLSLGLIWLLRWIPVAHQLDFLPVWAQPDPPTEISPEQVTLFAKIVLEMEPYRQEAQKQSEATTDETLKKDIRRDFIRKATEIITSNGMTVVDYNRITLRIREEEGKTLKAQVEEEIRKLQEATLPPAPDPINTPNNP
jgi:hypothetical protein